METIASFAVMVTYWSDLLVFHLLMRLWPWSWRIMQIEGYATFELWNGNSVTFGYARWYSVAFVLTALVVVIFAVVGIVRLILAVLRRRKR